ncbi:hypothetical protein HK100_008378, partial [Physocladia obscura]
MDKRTTKKQHAVALTQDVRALWASQLASQPVSYHQINVSQALTAITQSASLVASIPANTTLDRRAILPSLSPDPDLNDYPFVPDVLRIIELEYDWNLDKDSGDDTISIAPSDDKLYEEYYSQTPAPETNTESKDEDEDVMDSVVPELYEGIALSPLRKKNYVKLLNSSTGKIVEPPQKNCQECNVPMDWKVAGALQKQKAGNYTYQGDCAGECQKIGVNDDPDTGNPHKMAEHREIQKQAAEAADEAEKKQIMMESSFYAHNQA